MTAAARTRDLAVRPGFRAHQVLREVRDRPIRGAPREVETREVASLIASSHYERTVNDLVNRGLLFANEHGWLQLTVEGVAACHAADRRQAEIKRLECGDEAGPC